MRRYLLVMVVGVVVLATAGASVAALAQPSATPTAGTGVTVTVLGDVQPEGDDHHVMLVRVELPPGAEIGTTEPPGTVILYVEAGTVSYRLDSGEASVIRAGEQGGGEPLAAGPDAWVELAAGDRVVEQSGAEHAYRNSSDTTAVVLLSGLYVDLTGVRCGGGCWGD